MTTGESEARPHGPHASGFLGEVLRGLSASPRTIPCKWFYDREGSRLFDRITEQEDYYPTAAETALLETHAAQIAEALGARVDLVELGSGSSIKTRVLLDALRAPLRYVPVDISAGHLREVAGRLVRAYPDLHIEPLVADYSSAFEGPRVVPSARRVVFFPGSSVGNFEPAEAVAFLGRCRMLAGPGGVVLVGVDLPKDRETLERAYDDRAGVTRQFNLNLLVRMQRELAARLELDAFEHRAVWQEGHSRIEMRLVATRATTVEVGGRAYPFARGEHLVTEHCYKHGVEPFRELARQAGLRPGRVWHDPPGRMSMHWLDA